MNARRLALLALVAALPSFGCEREAGATDSPLLGSSGAPADAAAQRRAEIDAMGLDELIVAETRALEHTAELLAAVEDVAAAKLAATQLADVKREVADLIKRRAALAADHATPKNRLAYAMQRETFARTKVRVATELERLGAIEGVRDVLESAVTPILDTFSDAAR